MLLETPSLLGDSISGSAGSAGDARGCLGGSYPSHLPHLSCLIHHTIPPILPISSHLTRSSHPMPYHLTPSHSSHPLHISQSRCPAQMCQPSLQPPLSTPQCLHCGCLELH